MIKVIRWLNIVLAGLLAGTSFGIWVGFNPMNYSPSMYIEQQQHMVSSLNAVMVALVVLATLTSLISAYVNKRNKRIFLALITAAGFFAACIVISRFGNLPIQQQMLEWNINDLPGNWQELRDQWWQLHIYRTLAELIALALVAWAAVQDNPGD